MNGPTDFEILAYCEDELIWSSHLKIKGAKPWVKIKGMSFDVEEGYTGTLLYIKEIVVEVGNKGDVPFYINEKNFENILEVYFDDAKYLITRDHILVAPLNVTTECVKIPPNRSVTLKLIALCTVRSELLSEDHTVKVVLAKKIADEYRIPALNPKVEIVKLKIDDYGYLQDVILRVENNWISPISTSWIKLYINGDEVYFDTPTKKITGKAEVYLSVDRYVENGDRITVKLGKTEVTKTI